MLSQRLVLISVPKLAETLHAFAHISVTVHLVEPKITPLGYKVNIRLLNLKKKKFQLVKVRHVYFLPVLKNEEYKAHKRQESFHCWVIYIHHPI